MRPTQIRKMMPQCVVSKKSQPVNIPSSCEDFKVAKAQKRGRDAADDGTWFGAGWLS